MTPSSNGQSPAPARPARASEAEIVETLLHLVDERGADKTVCPSEVARALGGPHPDGWGPLMQSVRRVAVALTKAGRIAILRKGRPVPIWTISAGSTASASPGARPVQGAGRSASE